MLFNKFWCDIVKDNKVNLKNRGESYFIGRRCSMKKCIIASSGILLIIVFIIITYCFEFPIKADNSNLEECISSRLNKGYTSGIEFSNSIKMYDSISVGNKKYILVEINQQLGIIGLTQGIGERYKIIRMGYGTGNFKEEIIESNNKKYLIFGGRNISLAIAKISFILNHDEYSLDIPNKKLFLVYQEVDSEIEDTHINIEYLKFYNAEGNDISNQIEWNVSDL